MGRPARYPSEVILAAALRLAAKDPAALTISGIARAVGAPIGSIYHRFPSRDALLAELWIMTVESFQQEFIRTLELGDGLAAALYTPRFAREHLDEARLLLLYRREELASGPWPREIRTRARALRPAVTDALRRFALRHLGDAKPEAMRRTAFALVDMPLAAVRTHLQAGERPPLLVDTLVSEAYEALLGTRDHRYSRDDRVRLRRGSRSRT